MRQTFQLILYVAVATVLTAGCTGKRSQTEGESARQPQPDPCGQQARRVIALLDDYEAYPDRYHDGSYREPPAEKREDYIRFYRTQAENFVAAARQIPER